MKLFASFALVCFVTIAVNAQGNPTTAADYDKAFRYAVEKTNSAFPFVYTVVTETFESGERVSVETEVNQRQAAGVERDTQVLEARGKVFRSYSVMVGFGNHTYCSTDGKTWTGPQEYVCPLADDRPFTIFRPRKPDRVEYSVSESTHEGKPVKVYRKYAVFAANGSNQKDWLEEEIAVIDSRGFFVSVSKVDGTLKPRVVTRTQKQWWDFKTKFAPVVAPK